MLELERSLLRRVLASSTRPGDTGPPSSPAPIDSRYVPVATLGEGGMGSVRLCRDLRIGREVALKVVRQRHRSTARKLRFLREAQVQGQLEHPSIVPVYDLGTDLEGQLYLAMKRVRGRSLTDILENLRAGHQETTTAFTRHRLLGAFADICLAVDYAHTKGVIHRDLKPDNIMFGDFGEVYLLDWGLAHVSGEPDIEPDGSVAGAGSGSGPVNSAESSLTGTLGYMSPEQARRQPVDARSDVYALGTILFEILTLVPYVDRSGDPLSVLVRTTRGHGGRPSMRAPDRQIAPELDSISARATQLRPEDRFASVRELHDAVVRYLEGDRDLALRQRLGQAHAQAATEAAERAIASGDEAEHRRALRQVGKALALDPDNHHAVATLVHLFTEPPRQMPASARQELEDQIPAKLVARLRLAVLGYLTWIACLPLIFWMGVRSYRALTIVTGCFVACIFCGLYYIRKGTARRLPYPVVVLTCLAIGSTQAVLGPLFLFPMAALFAAMFLTLGPDPARRYLAVAILAVLLIVPVILEIAGLLPTSYAFRGGQLIVLPNLIQFSAVRTPVALALVNLAVLLAATGMMARHRNLMGEAERRLHLQAWQLRQIGPQVPRPPGHGPRQVAGLAPDPVEHD
jgi:serine/threonine-protein kinase